MSKLEVVSMINVTNISTHYLHHNEDNCTYKYNPKVYLGAKVSYARRWIYDSDEEDVPKHPSTHWPESLVKKYNSPFHMRKSHPMVI